MEKLAPDEKATFADEMEKAEMEARVDGLKASIIPSIPLVSICTFFPLS